MKVSAILRTLLLVVVVCVVLWVCVVFWWQVDEVQPTGRQMVIWLGVLPAGLLATWWLARAGLRWRRRRRERAEAGDKAGTATTVADDAIEEERPRYRLDIFAAAVNLPIGADPHGVLDALAAPARPRLHPRLRDHAGLPVFTAHVDDLDADAMRERFGEAGAVSDEQARGIALLEPVAIALFEDMQGLLPLPEAVEETVIAGLRRVHDAGPRPVVRVRAVLSQGWPQPLRQAVGDWLLALAEETGLAAAADMQLDVVPVAGPAQVWRMFDHLGRQDDDANEWQVVLACDSLVGERSVDALQASGMLMHGARPEGAIPGEGAAGLVLRKSGVATGGAPQALACMHTLVQGAAPLAGRSKDAARSSGELLLRAAALADADAERVSLVLSDADQRPSRALEAAAATSRAFPDLESNAQCLALGAACGYLGHVAPLAVLVVASAQVSRDAAGTVVLGLSGTDQRAAVTLLPPTQPEQDAGTSPEMSA